MHPWIFERRIRHFSPGTSPARLLLPLLALLTVLSYLFWDGMVADLVKASRGTPLVRMGDGCIDCMKVFGKGEVMLFIALLTGLTGYKKVALQIVAALVISALLVWPLKVTVHRERPRGNSFVSFPSGDAATAAATAVPIVAELPAMLPVAGVSVLAVAAGRVLVSAHYPSDVLAGIAVGLAAGALAISVCRRFRVPLQPRHFFFIITAFLTGWLVVGGQQMTNCALGRFLTFFGPGTAILIACHQLLSGAMKEE